MQGHDDVNLSSSSRT